MNCTIETESNVKSHCCHFALSDSTVDKTTRVPHFQKKCEKEHTETCDFCDLLPKIFVGLKNTLKKAHQDNIICDEDADNIDYDIDNCESLIEEYKHHVIRAYGQNVPWEKLINGCCEKTVFITMDWGKCSFTGCYNKLKW